MYSRAAFPVLVIFLLVAAVIYSTATMAAPACKGPNKNDPGCAEPAPEPEPPPADPIVVESVSVDWFAGKMILRGSGLSADPLAVTIGGSADDLTNEPVSDSQLELPFDSVFAAEVNQAGNYVLQVAGNVIGAIYFKGAVVDADATGCPCEDGWSQAPIGWGSQSAQCAAIDTVGQQDLAATIYTNPDDTLVYPQFPIGAAFVAGDPARSVCRLVQVGSDATVTDLVLEPINQDQQSECAALLTANICDTVTVVP